MRKSGTVWHSLALCGTPKNGKMGAQERKAQKRRRQMNLESGFLILYDWLPALQTLSGEDYKALVAKMFKGEITVSNAIDAEPAVTAVTVDYQGNIK